ncbi:MAG: SLC13 family permease [Pseudomonadota bacterium]
MPELTLEILVTLALLGLAVVLFASERLRVDVSALLLLALLSLTPLIPGVEIIASEEVFSGFSSNAVIALMAVMIIGSGLQRSGLMNHLLNYLLNYRHRGERQLMLLVSGTAGLAASVLQNIGSAALMAPLVTRLVNRAGLPRGRLMMPMAFAAIAGGTLTTIGSSPLILLNDLLPPEMAHFELFEVTPIGLVLLAVTLLFFATIGHHLLPRQTAQETSQRTSTFFQTFYGIDSDIYELIIPGDSPLAGRKLGVLERAYRIRFIGVQIDDQARVAPAKDVALPPNTVVAVLGHNRHINQFANASRGKVSGELEVFADALKQQQAGIAELVVPATSDYVGKSVGDIDIRSRLGLALLAVQRGEETHYKHLRELVLRPGDLLICHAKWRSIERLEKNRNLALMTTDFPRSKKRKPGEGEEGNRRIKTALGCLGLALGLVWFSPLSLAVALMIGAIAMVVLNVLSIDEAYRAISWKTVFLLAGLIPLGLAAEHSGTAQWLASGLLALFTDSPSYLLPLTALCIISALASLLLSNVGATVLLVPVAINTATELGSDPRLFALAIALSTTNAFILPTHPVNVLTMGAGGYQSGDYLRVGTPMTLIFLAATVLGLALLY